MPQDNPEGQTRCPHKPDREPESALKGGNQACGPPWLVPGAGHPDYTLPALLVLAFGGGVENPEEGTWQPRGSLRCRAQGRVPALLDLRA